MNNKVICTDTPKTADNIFRMQFVERLKGKKVQVRKLWYEI